MKLFIFQLTYEVRKSITCEWSWDWTKSCSINETSAK